MSREGSPHTEDVRSGGKNLDRDTLYHLVSEVDRISSALDGAQSMIDRISATVGAAELLFCAYAVYTVAESLVRTIARNVRRDADRED